MIKKEIRAKEGFEEIVETAKENILKIEEVKNVEIAELVAPIEAKYAVRLSGYEKLVSDYSEEYDVEVPDEEIVSEETSESEVIVSIAEENQAPIE